MSITENVLILCQLVGLVESPILSLSRDERLRLEARSEELSKGAHDLIQRLIAVPLDEVKQLSSALEADPSNIAPALLTKQGDGDI